MRMWTAIVAIMVIAGCSARQPAAKTPAPPSAEVAAPSAEKRTEFVRNLSQREKARFSDACRITRTLLDGEDKEGSFAEVRAALIAERVIPVDWTYVAESPLTKGMISHMLRNALKIRGGLTTMLVGTTQRYGLRECVWTGIVYDGSVDEYVSGGELLAIFSRAETYKKHGDLESLK
ncbi:MAG: hypothetical protein A2Z34_05925 [Planctomycetes bacterium RBG_16_59_8]|nr:MAG: hypothetical protein A2Z34_05925 [Planctomycetes bacterium RBG_16_59_8]